MLDRGQQNLIEPPTPSWRALGLVAALGLILAGSACSTRPVTQSSTFESALGFNRQDRWVVLARPNTIWRLGTIVQIGQGREPEDVGNIEALGCFPSDVLRVEQGSAPAAAYDTTIRYSLSLSATLGLSEAELARLGLSAGTGEPNYRTRLKLDRATERRYDLAALEGFLVENFTRMSRGCQRLMLDASRFMIDKVYQVDQGSIEVIRDNGASVDLSLPQYGPIRDAAFRAGLQTSENGQLLIPAGHQPVTFAVRVADFGRVLREIGFERRTGADQLSFEDAMLRARAAVPAN